MGQSRLVEVVSNRDPKNQSEASPEPTHVGRTENVSILGLSHIGIGLVSVPGKTSPR